jgi:DNA-binding XRE family transcriptional regulator
MLSKCFFLEWKSMDYIQIKIHINSTKSHLYISNDPHRNSSMADYPIASGEQLRAYLRALRKTRGMTQQDLANRLGVTRPRVWKIEQAPGDVTLTNLLSVLTALGVQLTIHDPQDSPQTAAIPKSHGSWE